MFRNISLLTGLCLVWFLITKARGNVYFTNITRDGNNDIFTKEFCEESCRHFGATSHSGGCECNSSDSDSVFLRSKRKCVSGKVLRDKDEGCRLYWDVKVPMRNIKVINADEANSYTFIKPGYHSSCQLTPFIAFLDAAGNWTPFSLPGDVLEVLNGNIALSRSSTIKITRQSPILTNLSGHIIKVNLNCTGIQQSGVTCLMFRIKGVLKFPLCNYTTQTTTPSLPPPTPTSAVTTSTAVNKGSITPSTITTPSTTTTTTPPTPDGGNTDWIIAAIVIIGIVLFLALIGAFVFLFKHHYICTLRSRQDVAREFEDFAVINNPGQQSYRIQEEPLYIELPDVYPSNRQIADNSMEISEGKQSTEELVLSHSYAKDASLPSARPLPSRPDLEENRHMENGTTPVYQNDGHEVNDQRNVSMVLMNPGIQMALLRSLPGKRTDVDDLPPARKKIETQSDHQHHHHHHHHHHDTADGAEEDEDVDYQGLAIEKRAKSMFICPSCNENSDYQRLSKPGHCPHGRNNDGREKSASFYESLTLERGTRESFYASPSCDDEDGERNADQIPEYQVLEPEETGSDEVLDESVDHDYNVLEQPEPANGSDEVLVESVDHDYNVLEEPEPGNDELDEDNNKIGDPRPTDNSGELLEPSVILDTEENPAYAVPLKKTITEKPEPVRNELDEDNNKTRDPRPADENPEEPFEPPVILKIDDNPLYSLPWKKNITEEPGRKRSYSM